MRRVWAASLDLLEIEMALAQRGMGVDPSHALGKLRAQFPAWTISRNVAGWSAEYREGSRLHYVFGRTSDELADALAVTEP